VAFVATGPGALLAFALNGVIAALTALSFAEMASAFPESGGTYTFAKKVLSVEAAFGVGWVVWFASIVAGVLYSFGFAAYAVVAVERLCKLQGVAPPHWVDSHWTLRTLAAAATAWYAASLLGPGRRGVQWATVGKVVLFGVLIIAGLRAFAVHPRPAVGEALTPFLPEGAPGLLRAMGYTFIALQGFDLIAAVAGEVREPARTIPRAMLLSLGLALAIYLPLLFLIPTAGLPSGESLAAATAREPAAIVAIAARQFMGGVGYWLVVVAALLSMLSALQANLYAASRVALSMARDRTLPGMLKRLHGTAQTPGPAIFVSASAMVLVLFIIPDLAAAGAASSLIFLLSFALAHWTSFLARRRGPAHPENFRSPWFPAVPVVGGLACGGLAAFQALAVPVAGVITAVWMGVGTVLFISLLARRARIFDASMEARDPDLMRLRGRSPLVLVPIANPVNAPAMVAVATALAPPDRGRVLLLSIVRVPERAWQGEDPPPSLHHVQEVLGRALAASFSVGLAPEALTTVARDPWAEIARVSRLHRCESLLLGLSNLEQEATGAEMDRLLGQVDSDVVILRAPPGWRLSDANRILVPIGGRGGHDQLRARLLSSLCRSGPKEVTYLRVLPPSVPEEAARDVRRHLQQLGSDEVPGTFRVEVVTREAPVDEIVCRALDNDLVVLGLQRLGRRRKVVGKVSARIARETGGALIIISRRG